MNKRKVIKNIIRVLLVVCALTTIMEILLYGTVSATGISTGIPSNEKIGIGTGYDGVAGAVMGVVQYICYGAAVIIVVIIGVRYMTAAPEGKAEIKKQSIYMAVGAAIMFAAGTIVKLVQKVGAATIQ